MKTVGTIDWLEIGVKPHPVLPLPGPVEIERMGPDGLAEFLNEREKTLRAMEANPLRSGYEPPMWAIADALLGFEWVDPAWAKRVRVALLGQEEPVMVLLIQGGNRASKTEWAAKRGLKLILGGVKRRAWSFQQSSPMSIETQQPVVFKYLPPELKLDRGIKARVTYVSYKQQTGFSEGRFTLPNGSDWSFRNYEQDIKTIEGGEVDYLWFDELVPLPWIETGLARIATRRGRMPITFTPKDGYTVTVKKFQDMARVMHKSTAFLVPKDGGDPDLPNAVRQEDVMAWIERDREAQPRIHNGREFEEVPRVACVPSDRRRALLWFHSSDNPMGNPEEVAKTYLAYPAAIRKMRYYGVAEKMVANKFPLFDPQVHVIKRSEVPPEGTWVHKVDPCSGRNMAMIWVKVLREAAGLCFYVVREWPQPGDYIPGVGDPGPWAEPGAKLDGGPGPGQKPFGFGLDRYKEEMGRVEEELLGVKSVELGSAAVTKFDKWDVEDRRPTRRRFDFDGAVYERWMDSRYGNSPTTTQEGVTTLIEEFASIGVDFAASRGDRIDEGTALINSALYWDRRQKLSALNRPRLRVCENCQNVVFALQNWTGADGLHGACKDFVDVLRYLLVDDPEDIRALRSEKREET